MNNNLLQLKIKQRLNKLSSYDNDNLECWMIAEAFNKAQIEWVRRQIQGYNAKREGEDGSKMAIDDLQRLIVNKELKGKHHGKYFETEVFPDDYLYINRISVIAERDCCSDISINAHIEDVSEIDTLLIDENRKPSFEWRDTFYTLGNNKVRVYIDDFRITKCVLYFYRKPVKVQFDKCIVPETGKQGKNVECMFKDDIVEIMIDEAATILAGDIENQLQLQRNKQNAQMTS